MLTGSSRGRLPPVLALLLAATLLALLACGTDNGAGSGGVSQASEVEKISLTDRVFTIEDLQGLGMKADKEYDAADLPSATSAWHATFNQLEYEARFYPSHADAVSFGTEWADIVTGEDAVVVGDDVRWEEGARDRRKCSRNIAHSGCTYSARYGDYVIAGNLVLLCEGRNSEEALPTCQSVLAKLN